MSRILVATVPVPAHTRFPLPVVARLVERGHEVLWFASSRARRAAGGHARAGHPNRGARPGTLTCGRASACRP